MKTIAIISTLFSIALTGFIGYWWWQLDHVRITTTVDRGIGESIFSDRSVLGFLAQQNRESPWCVVYFNATSTEQARYCFYFERPKKIQERFIELFNATTTQ